MTAQARFDPPPFDSRAFRDALGCFATGVTVVTTIDGEGWPVGVTANSYNSVSLDPPMVLWSLAHRSSSMPAFMASEAFAIHVLHDAQETLAQRFARRGDDKFHGLRYRLHPRGVPLLDNCAARFLCETAHRYEGGDHIIFVGRVFDFERAEHRPLIFHRGRFARIHHARGSDAR